MKTLFQLVPLATLALAAASFVGMAGAGPSAAGAVPNLAPAGEPAPMLTLAAQGVQIYECRATGSDPEWAFVAPEAELFDHHGRRVGSHGAGPFWHAVDGSHIVGSLVARSDAPVAGAIPWLLLQARSTGADGLLSRVGHVQRVNTAGGLPPAGGCRSDNLGQTLRVPYRADYHFYDTQP